MEWDEFDQKMRDAQERSEKGIREPGKGFEGVVL